MNKLCIVLTTDYSGLKDSQKKEWQTENASDLETIYQTLEDHDIIEVKVDVLIKNNNIEKAIEDQLSPEIFDHISSCHIVINSHGNIVNKDLQDIAIKKVIELVSEHFIPISQLTGLVCYAMAEDNTEAALERLIEKRGHTAEYVTEIKTRQTAFEILSKKISKMELAFPQKFSIWGPTTAYNPHEEQELVAATLQQRTLFDVNNLPRNKSILIQIDQISIEDFKARIRTSLSWLEKNADGTLTKPLRIEAIKKKLTTEEAKQNFTDTYAQHVTFLGKILDELYSQLEKIYTSSTAKNKTTTFDACHFLHLKLIKHSLKIKTTLNGLPQLKKVYTSWKAEFRANSSQRLQIYHQYLDNRFTTTLPSGAAAHIVTPPPSPDSSTRPTSPDSPLFSKMSMFVNTRPVGKQVTPSKEGAFLLKN